MDNRGYIRYNESFKRQVVSEIKEGTFESAGAASRAYGIKGRETVKKELKAALADSHIDNLLERNFLKIG